MGATFLGGKRAFPASPIPTWQIVATADVNRDGHPDLVWRRVSSGASVVWYLNGTALIGQANFPTVPDDRRWQNSPPPLT